ncbi:MAG: ion channel [Waltera sp.]
MSTLLTVGYGDIYPITTLGRIMAICIAYLGVGAVAIPTGIISAGFVELVPAAKAVSLILKRQIFMRSPRSS